LAQNESITKEVLKHLADHLKKEMPELRQILLDFPEANKSLVYPSVSLFVQAPEYTPEMNPYLHNFVDISQPMAPKHKVRYVSGEYDWKIQADIWCQYKEERHRLYDQFYKAFNSQFPTLGLTLEMKDYFEVLCRYDMIGFNYGDDGELSSQTKEWRVKIDIIGHCKAIIERTESIIETTELDVTNINDEIII